MLIPDMKFYKEEHWIVLRFIFCIKWKCVWMTTNESNSYTDFILLFLDHVSLSLFQLLYNTLSARNSNQILKNELYSLCLQPTVSFSLKNFDILISLLYILISLLYIISNLTKLEFVALDISGKNYLTWILDAKIHLEVNEMI